MNNKALPIRMTKGEKIAGFIYIPIYILFLGTIIYLALALLGIEPNELNTNIVYYYVNFLFTVIAFRKYLTSSLSHFGKNLSSCVMYTVIGFGLYLSLNIAMTVVLTAAFGDFSNPNNDYIGELYDQSSKVIIVGAVLLAPIVEECLFRGVIFGTIFPKNRVLAYLASFVVFSAIHVLAYAFESPDWMLLVNVLQYLPPTLAFCWLYEKSGNIFCPVLLHTIINAIAITAMYA